MMDEDIRKNAQAVSLILEYVAKGKKNLTPKQVEIVNILFEELYSINRDKYKENEER